MELTRAERREKKRKKRMHIHGKMDALINSIKRSNNKVLLKGKNRGN